MRILGGSGQVEGAARRRWRGILAVCVVVAAAPAHAEDGGFLGFLRSALGGDAAPAPPAAQQPAAGAQPAPLTVRRSPRKTAGAGRARLARLPGRTGPVSIFEDPTLRDGDAVMTKDGMRVFAGGRFSPDHPYNEADFVTVSSAKAVAPGLKRTVIELNKLPPG